MHFNPRHRLRPLSPLLLSFALGCSGPAPEQDSEKSLTSEAQPLSSKRALPPGLAASLVKDIQAGADLTGRMEWKDSNLSHSPPVTIGSTSYFMAYEASTGHELWRTDGTLAGTRLVREFIPGPTVTEGEPSLVAVGDTLYVRMDGEDGSGESMLWKSDGTPEGTVRLDLRPGTDFRSTGTLLSCNGKVFIQNIGSEGGIWASDGTPEGTRKISDSSMFPYNPRAACSESGLFFVALNPYGFGEALWRSNGTPEGTVYIGRFDIPDVWGTDPSPIVAMGPRVFFTTLYDGLWMSDDRCDGSDEFCQGAVRITDDTGMGPLYPSQLAVVEGTLYFQAYNSWYENGLWTSDGTPAGTRMMTGMYWGYGFQPTGKVGDDLLFMWGSTLYRTRGTTGSPELLLEVFDLNDGPGASAPLPDGRLLLAGTMGWPSKTSLWVTDGTEPTLLQPASGPALDRVMNLVPQGDHVLFWGDDGIHGLEPWVTDGTPEGTRLVRDIYRGDTSTPQSLTDLGGTLFFTAYDSEHGRELWKSDGTAEGTLRLTDFTAIHPSYEVSGPMQLTPVGGSLFFFHGSGLAGRAPGYSLWKTDGTPEGTVLVQEGLDTSFHATGSLGTTFFFTATRPTLGTELWKSDGTATGTVLVKDINPSQRSAAPTALTSVGDALFFIADDGAHGRELWKTDGTPEGTQLVKDLRPGPQSGNPGGLVNAAGTLFFTADDGVHGPELWKSDGTAEGTVLVTNLPPRPYSYTPLILVAREGTVFFIADDGVHGRELWKSDGTAEGTQLVADIAPGAASSLPLFYNFNYSGLRPVTVRGGTLYFAADDGVHGTELWKSDGTAGGTVLVSDLTPGAGSTPFQDVPFVAAGPHADIVFPVATSAAGLELWTSDGTAGGTRLLADVNPGPISASPSALTFSGSRLFFVADEGEHGRELWSVKQAALLHTP